MHILLVKEGEETFDLVLPDNTKSIKFSDGLVPSYVEFFEENDYIHEALNTSVYVPKVDEA